MDSQVPTRRITTANYHFLRECPYRCKYCFYPQTNREYLDLEQSFKGLRELRNAGIRKITFSGGEPFVHAKHLGEMVKFSHELGFAEVSVVTNARLVRKNWFQNYGKYLTQLCVSCDSFDPETNVRIGRCSNEKDESHVQRVFQVRQFCTEFGVAFKLNTTVSTENWKEDMVEMVRTLQPSRWKVFQCLPVPGENCGQGAPRDASDLFISQEQFDAFLELNRDVGDGVLRIPETNEQMENSYMILDQNMCILRNVNGYKIPTKNSILNASIESVLAEANLDHNQFFERGGDYTISRPDPVSNLDW